MNVTFAESRLVSGIVLARTVWTIMSELKKFPATTFEITLSIFFVELFDVILLVASWRITTDCVDF